MPTDPGGQTGPEDPGLGLLCFIVGRSMEARVTEALAGEGFEDLTAAQGRVFARIGPIGTRLGDLADQARVSKQTAGFLVDQLVRAGYVRRVADPSDGRARLVQIAERGQAALAVARRTELAVEAEWEAHLGASATAELRRMLMRLREVTDPYRDPPGTRARAAHPVDP